MEIKFNVIEGFEWSPKPEKASKTVPVWFKEMPERAYTVPQSVVDGETEQTIDVELNFPNGTAKLCAPFADALTSGYTIPLPMQVFVRAREEQKVIFSWNPVVGHDAWAPIQEHGHVQIPGLGLGLETSGIFKFQIPWSIEVPEGYAVLYTHPFNRPDLPFQSFSGIVDSGYNSPVNIPFIWIAGSDHAGIIDAGTPVAQIFPFKLEEWEHSFGSKSETQIFESAKIATTYVTGYRRMFRRQKVWR